MNHVYSGRLLSPRLLSLLFLALACNGNKHAAKESPVELPFTRIPSSGDDPADNGPDDETVLRSIEGPMGEVAFEHFTHASNGKTGCGIPCLTCHHDAKTDDDSSACSDCHEAPDIEKDYAHLGPDDNMMLTPSRATKKAVPFNHFTHASKKGYGIACARCHHKTDSPATCGSCHGNTTVIQKGKVVPKRKRAFHLQCQGCHREILGTNHSSDAPIHCLQCHTGRHRSPGTEMVTLERAYHLGCVGCHHKIRQVKEGARAPVTCAQCHPNKKPSMAPINRTVPGSPVQ